MMISLNQLCTRTMMDTNVKVQMTLNIELCHRVYRFQQKHDVVSPTVCATIAPGSFRHRWCLHALATPEIAAVETLLGRQFRCQCEAQRMAVVRNLVFTGAKMGGKWTNEVIKCWKWFEKAHFRNQVSFC